MSVPKVDSTWYREVEEAAEFFVLMNQEDRLLYVNHPQPGVGNYVGLSVYEFVDPEYHEVLRKRVIAARDTGFPQHFLSKARGPNGETSTYSNWLFGLPADAGILVFISTDVTHQDRVEAALERSESTLRSLIENSPDIILMVDRQRNIQFINRDEVGFGTNRILGSPAESFVPQAEREKVVRAIESVLTDGVPTQYETELTEPDGFTRRYTTRLAPIGCEGQVDRVMLVATDITDRCEAERERERLSEQLQQAQKMEALGQLTGGVAHDFNNLLTAINHNCELAKITSGDANQARLYLDQAIESIHRASTLTQRLLAFSRKQSLRPTNVNANALIDGMTELLRRTLGETIRVQTSTPNELWSCKVDPGQLEIAILNLAVNAQDAMSGGGELTIRNENHTQQQGFNSRIPSGEYVRISVSDNGKGMTAEVAAQACEPFFTTKDVGLGSGLGLSMVYGFVRQSDGYVQINSTPDLGTTIEIYLPRCEEKPASHSRDNPVDDIARGNQELILLVEDDPAVRSSVSIILQTIGYRTEVAESADAAIAFLAARPEFALVLSDVVLPGGVNGFELATQARLLVPNLPFLLMSGYPERVLKQNRVNRELRVLEKPHTLQQLSHAIREVLSEGSRASSVHAPPASDAPFMQPGAPEERCP